MSEDYTAEEFAKCFSLRGYGKKKVALKWLEDRGMNYACEEDFEKCYRDMNPQYIGANKCSLWADGQNPSDPKYMENSHGRSFNYYMRLEQKRIDAVDRWAKSRKDKTHDVYGND